MNGLIQSHVPFVDGIVFDFGGVIARSPRGVWKAESFCLAYGLSKEAFDLGFAQYRGLLDSDKMTLEEMYQRIFADNAISPLTDTDLAELVRLDEEGWSSQFSERTFSFMLQMKAMGKKLGVLSNMSSHFAETRYKVYAAAYRSLLDAEVLSGYEGICKPDARMWKLMSERLGVVGSRLLFVDDSPANVTSARNCGWRAEIYLEQVHEIY